MWFRLVLEKEPNYNSEDTHRISDYSWHYWIEQIELVGGMRMILLMNNYSLMNHCYELLLMTRIELLRIKTDNKNCNKYIRKDYNFQLKLLDLCKYYYTTCTKISFIGIESLWNRIKYLFYPTKLHHPSQWRTQRRTFENCFLSTMSDMTLTVYWK